MLGAITACPRGRKYAAMHVHLPITFLQQHSRNDLLMLRE